MTRVARPALWPSRVTLSLSIGLVAGAILLGVELLRRPAYMSISTAFVASSGFGPVLLGLGMGSMLALGRAPTDVALGRDAYLCIAGVRPVILIKRSILLSVRDSGVAAAVCVLTAALIARVVLPAGTVDPDVLPWTVANDAPALAELAVWSWMTGAAALVVAVVHVATAAGAGRVLAGVVAPLVPVLATAAPGPLGGVVEDMLGPRSWAVRREPEWWTVLGGALMWTLAALLAAAVAILLTRRSGA